MSVRVRLIHVVVVAMVAVLAIAFWPAVAAPGDAGGPAVKIGVVDYARAASGSEMIKKAMADMNAAAREAEAQHAPAQKELKELDEKIRSADTPADEKKRLEQLHAEKSVAHRRAVEDTRARLSKLSLSTQADIEQKLKAAISELAKEQAFSVILRKTDGLLYSEERLDVTSAVIKRLDGAK